MRKKIKTKLSTFLKNIFISLIIILGTALNATPLMHPYNLDFEEGSPGEMPRGWLLPEYAVSRNYNASLTGENVKSGKYCLELSRFAEFKDSIYGSVMQSIDAKPYRGKNIKFGAWVRAEIAGPVGSAHLWLIEYLPGENIRFYDLMENNPIVINTWEYYEITADISEESEFINFGLMLKGNGKAWIDGASLEIINQDNNAANTPPKKLSGREIENLSAFAKLYGFARYFSPSTESLSVDWEKFALYGIKESMIAPNDKELRNIFSEMFSKFNPAIKIFDPKLPPEDYYYSKKPVDALEDAAIAWLHIGSPTIPDNKLSSSKPVNVFQSLRETEGAVVQILDASAYSGKKIIFRIKAKADLILPNGRAEIRLLPETDNKNFKPKELIKITSVKENKWLDYSVETVLPENTKGLRIGLVLSGDGKVYFDDASLREFDSGKETKIDLRNPDFEDDMPGKLAHGWRFVPASETSGYSAEIITSDKKSGSKSLLLSSDLKSSVKLPQPGELFMANISKNLRVSMPLCFYTDMEGTLPHSSNIDELHKKLSEVKLTTAKDLYMRLALLTEAWNIFKLFNSYSRNFAEWDALFNKLISKAAEDKNEREFLLTLELLSKKLNDSQSRVWRSGETFYYGLPFLMKWTGKELMITRVHSSCKDVNPGDIIKSINGTDVHKYLDSIGNYISTANEPRMYLRAVAALRTGMENTLVRMVVQNRENKEKEMEFRRNVFLSDLSEERLPAASMLRDGIFYIDLTRITDKGFFELIDTLSKARGIILDLRGNTSISEHIMSFFIREPIKTAGWRIPVFIRPEEKIEFNKPINIDIKARGNFAGVSLVFLQDERTIGFSEALISLARDFNIGKIIGKEGAGTGGEISSFSLGRDYGFSWTTIKGVDKMGNDIYGSGIKPTVDNNILIDKDETLQLAFEIIN